jgi:PEP-CTERM motif-containing protein
MRTRNVSLFLIPTFLCVLVNARTASADPITYPGPILFPMGSFDPLALGPPGSDHQTIDPFEIDRWTLSITNTGSVPWCDFEVGLIGRPPRGAIFGPLVGLRFTIDSPEAIGFGTPTARDFITDLQFDMATTTSTLPCDPMLLVGQNQTFILDFRVINTNGVAFMDYAVCLRPSAASSTTPGPACPAVPEPTSLLLFSSGLLGVFAARLARHKRSAL